MTGLQSLICLRINDDRRTKLMLPQELQLLQINPSGICPQSQGQQKTELEVVRPRGLRTAWAAGELFSHCFPPWCGGYARPVKRKKLRFEKAYLEIALKSARLPSIKPVTRTSTAGRKLPYVDNCLRSWCLVHPVLHEFMMIKDKLVTNG